MTVSKTTMGMDDDGGLAAMIHRPVGAPDGVRATKGYHVSHMQSEEGRVAN
jgi:hypothetical protein